MTVPSKIPYRLYWGSILLLGGGILVSSALQWESTNLVHFATYVIFALAASVMKLALPAIKGSLSVNFFFVLVGVVQLSLVETLTITTASFLFQYFWRGKTRRPAQAMFNVASGAIAVYLTHATFHWPLLRQHCDTAVALTLAACVYFLANTSQVAMIIAITERRRSMSVWTECYVWMFPYYLFGAWLVGAFDFASRYAGWPAANISLCVLAFVHRSYNEYLTKLQGEKEKAQEQQKVAEAMSALHLRTIEALALAIEAKDETTNEHLQRLHVYALEMGKELGLPEADLEALQAAALLHDIGKLAVPEHILSKPGPLTPEEFEKLKVHPIVGSEILQCVQFPYDVASIVRWHHERWDGSGYPDGLKGEEIPMGARILAAVDCLDSVSRDRPDRKKLSLEKAVALVAAQSGRDFDPRVVDVLQRRYQDYEAKTRLLPEMQIKVSKRTGAECENKPLVHSDKAGAHRLMRDPNSQERSKEFLHTIGAAREEAQLLFEIAKELGSSLRLEETLSMVAGRLKKLVPYDTMVAYRLLDNRLKPEFATGLEVPMVETLRIPMGKGLSGWVAANKLPILNGNPASESGYLNDSRILSGLQSALSVPLLDASDQLVGVLTLYESHRESYSRDHLRVLQAISEKLSQTMQNSLEFRKAEDSATTDFLTGLANARSMFVRLAQDVVRCNRSNLPLAVLVGDLNGFKQINDELGHLEGNRLLQMAADAIRSQCRDTDFAARMGGDEFVVIMPGINSADTERIGERYAETVRQAWLASDNGKNSPHIHFGMSLGFGFLGEDGFTPEELLAAGDKRMYAAKAKSKRLRQQLADAQRKAEPALCS